MKKILILLITILSLKCTPTKHITTPVYTAVWSLVAENDVTSYYVQTSATGKSSWATIAVVTPKGTNSVYRYVLPSIGFYRIQVNCGSLQFFSQVESVSK
jgi:hypothetical protein